MSRPRTTYSPHTIDYIASRLEAGDTQRAIARELGKDPRTISDLIARTPRLRAILAPKKAAREALKARMRALRAQGYTYHRIARELGAVSCDVYRVLNPDRSSASLKRYYYRNLKSLRYNNQKAKGFSPLEMRIITALKCCPESALYCTDATYYPELDGLSPCQLAELFDAAMAKLRAHPDILSYLAENN